MALCHRVREADESPRPAGLTVVNAFSVLSQHLLKIDSHVSVDRFKVLQGIHGLSLFYGKENTMGVGQKVLSHMTQS